MPPRDKEQTARNKLIARLTIQLRSMLPQVLSDTKASNIHSLHANFATRKAQYIDLKNQVITSPEHYFSLFLKGLKEDLDAEGDTLYSRFYENLFSSEIAKRYMFLFFKRNFLTEFENLTKIRPEERQAEVWIGQNNADFGLLVSPRFRNGEWENDASEIRRFKKRYWSIGHVLETGFVIPDREELRNFSCVDHYLDFFRDIVRQAGSKYQREIADKYCDFVVNSDTPEEVLLLLPELRFLKDKKHRYRLDFCIINVASQKKVGFEISPWSSHGKLTGTKSKTQREINEEAKRNFEKEARKHRDYFLEYGILTLIYTDADLENLDEVFSDIAKYLEIDTTTGQPELAIINDFFE